MWLLKRETLMNHLAESIDSSLRSSDLYIPYSSSQFLIMTLGTGRKDMDTITGRIAHVFPEKAGKETNAAFFYDFNQMKSRNYPTGQL